MSVHCSTLLRYAGEQTMATPAFTVEAQSQPLPLTRRGRCNTCLEKYVVTSIKSSEIKAKRTTRMPSSMDGLQDGARAKARRPRKPTTNQNGVEDAAYAQAHKNSGQERQSAIAKPRLSALLAHGKDLVSGEAASVAAAAAIVVGAALIEVELIPGLIIGAGAILLGKLFPEMGVYVRPAIKGAVRAGFFVTRKAREVMAETSEQVHDLVAEVKHEQDQTDGDKNEPSVNAAVDGSQPAH